MDTRLHTLYNTLIAYILLDEKLDDRQCWPKHVVFVIF